MGGCMEVEDTEHGVQRLRLTEQTTFKLIWVRSILFVHWQHKDVRVAVTHGPPATKFIFRHKRSLGTRTKKAMQKE